MKKFLNFSKVLFVLSLVLVVGFAPTTAKASAVGFTTPVFRLFRYNQGQMFHVEMVNASIPNKTANFWSLVGSSIDNSNVNMRFNFSFSPSGASTDEHANFYGESYNVRFIFGCKNYQDGKVYAFVPQSATMCVLYVNYVDGTQDALTLDNSKVLQPVSGSSFSSYVVSLDLVGFRDAIVESFDFSIYFNFHDCYGVPVDNPNVNAMDMYIGSLSFANTTVVYEPSIDVPIVNSPDLDSMPDITPFVPGVGNPIVDAFNLMYSNSVIKTSMIIVTVVGIVAFVLYGRRK